MREKYFDIERDKQFPYFCRGCLVGKTEEQMSTVDARYCVDCQPLIASEYALLFAGSHKKRYIPTPHVEMDTDKEREVLLHTKPEDSHLYQNLPVARSIDVGGRPRKDISVDLIHKLCNEGLSIGKIVKEFRAQGQLISAMTVSRVLSGQRS